MTNTRLDEDSPDLTDEEILSALDVPSAESLSQGLLKMHCPECGQVVHVTSHALRRRKPWMYWRVGVSCPSHHATIVTFRASWLPATYEDS